jgi:hypothetical protein
MRKNNFVMNRIRLPLRSFAPLFTLALLLTSAPVTVAAPAASAANAALAKSLTLHASFDHGPNADFARGDRTLYTYATSQQRAAGGVVGLPDDTVKLTQGSGRFGNAMLFTKKGNVKPYFKDGGNIGYNASDWNYTVSVWLRLSPDIDLEPGYSDPVQFVGNDGNKGFIFLEFDKDSKPRLFRYAIRPLIEIWDPGKVGWANLPFEKRPMVQVERAPFSHARWTHCVFTAEHINSKSAKPSGKLYIDGQLQGAIRNWDLTFGWNADSALLVLGAAYVGHLDELSVFDRSLSDDEVKVLFNLQNGVRDLHVGRQR